MVSISKSTCRACSVACRRASLALECSRSSRKEAKSELSWTLETRCRECLSRGVVFGFSLLTVVGMVSSRLAAIFSISSRAPEIIDPICRLSSSKRS